MNKHHLKHISLYILSFFIPAVIITVALIGLGIAPFGDNSLAISDGNGLYINYLGYVSRAVRGQEDVLFSFEKGLGSNMMGSWGWFLLNPTFTIFALFDITQYHQAFTIVSVLNFCFCGLTMYILLKDIYGNRISNLMFSTAYAMNGFLVANVFQMNFFVCIPVLPIMVLGLRRILKNRSPLIYILSLTYSLLMNFYFGYMLCVASLLIFVIVFFMDRSMIVDRKSAAVTYLFSSLLAGTLSAVVWLPALLSLRGGRLNQSIVSAISIKENMPFLDMASKFFLGANTIAELQNGLPNIFVGLLPVALMILFFMSNNIGRQKKTVAGLLLGVYLLSFYIPVFNIAMHGGTVTNWFNYRDSFVFSFLLLMIAAEEWSHIAEEPEENLRRTAVIFVIVTLLVFSKRFSYITGGEVLIDFFILVVMYAAFWMHRRNAEKNPRYVLEMVVLLLLCIELFLNYDFSTKKIMEWTNSVSDYQEIVTPVSAMIDAVKMSDTDFYRMEVSEQRSGNQGNDPMLYGYNGVGHGGSDDRDFIRNSLGMLGIRQYDMRSSYYESVSAATDTLLGLKYIVSKGDLEKEKQYERLVDIGQWKLYKNPNALPIALLSNSEIEGVEIELTDVFENLNQIYSAITGKTEHVFIEESAITFNACNTTTPEAMTREEAARIVSSRDLSIADQKSDEDSSDKSKSDANFGFQEYKNRGSLKEKPKNQNSIEFRWTADRDGTVYIYNRSGIIDRWGAPLPALDCLGYYHKGETVIGYLPMENSLVTQYLLEEVAGRFRAAYTDLDVLAKMSQTILSRPSEIEKIKDSHLRGNFTAKSGQELMFTIPYDEGWTLTIDGKKTEIKQVLGVFMAADVEPGEHTYVMRFVPTGLRTGVVLFLISLFGLIITIFCLRRKRPDKPDNSAVANMNIAKEDRKFDEPTLDSSSDCKAVKTEREKGDLPQIPNPYAFEHYNSNNATPQRRKEEKISELPLNTASKYEFFPSKAYLILLLGSLIIVSFLISIRSAYNIVAPFLPSIDSSVFEYVGRMMSKGKVMYVDTFDHKGPLLYFLNWIGVSAFFHYGGVGLIEFVAVLTSAVLCYRIFRLFCCRELSLVSMIVIMLQLCNYYEHGNTVEEYALPFIFISLYIFTKYFLERPINWGSVFLCGICFACVLLLRQNMIAVWTVFIPAIIVKEKKNCRRLAQYILWFLSGMIFAFLPTFVYLSYNHAFGAFFDSYVAFNFRYSSSSLADRYSAIRGFGSTGGFMLAVGTCILMFILKCRHKVLCRISLIYLIVNLVFVGIAGNGFTHYGLILIPGYVLPCAFLMEYLQKRKLLKKTVVVMGMALISLVVPCFQFLYSDLQDYRDNRDLYSEVAAATVIQENTKETDKIIVCGNQDIIYNLSKREAASRFSYQLPIADYEPAIYNQFLNDLEDELPEVIVVSSSTLNGAIKYDNLYPVISAFIKDHEYVQWGQIGELTLFGKHALKK